MNDQVSSASHQLEMLTKKHTLMADHLLHIPPSNDLKLRAQHQPPTKTLLKILRIRRLVRAFVSKHVGRLAGALGGAKLMLLGLLSKKDAMSVELRRKIRWKWRAADSKDLSCICGRVEMHLNLLPPSLSRPSSPWSETTAVLEPREAQLCYSFYDPSWNAAIPPELQLPAITRYLEWSDEEYQMEDSDDDEEGAGGGCHEIDSLAERFIARCHERFMLEKQESYRRYQEILARSM